LFRAEIDVDSSTPRFQTTPRSIQQRGIRSIEPSGMPPRPERCWIRGQKQIIKEHKNQRDWINRGRMTNTLKSRGL